MKILQKIPPALMVMTFLMVISSPLSVLWAQEEPAPPIDIFDPPTSESFKKLNPLHILSSPYEEEFSSPAGILNRAMQFIFPLAGLILFFMLVWGGFEIVSSAHNSKSMEKGRQRVTTALIGFLLLFSSYWIMQILEYVFDISLI